jgi:hypothetical protein
MKILNRMSNAIALTCLLAASMSASAGVVATSVPEPDIVTLIALGGIVVLLVNRSRKN